MADQLHYQIQGEIDAAPDAEGCYPLTLDGQNLNIQRKIFLVDEWGTDLADATAKAEARFPDTGVFLSFVVERGNAEQDNQQDQ